MNIPGSREQQPPHICPWRQRVRSLAPRTSNVAAVRAASDPGRWREGTRLSPGRTGWAGRPLRLTGIRASCRHDVRHPPTGHLRPNRVREIRAETTAPVALRAAAAFETARRPSPIGSPGLPPFSALGPPERRELPGAPDLLPDVKVAGQNWLPRLVRGLGSLEGAVHGRAGDGGHLGEVGDGVLAGVGPSAPARVAAGRSVSAACRAACLENFGTSSEDPRHAGSRRGPNDRLRAVNYPGRACGTEDTCGTGRGRARRHSHAGDRAVGSAGVGSNSGRRGRPHHSLPGTVPERDRPGMGNPGGHP